MNILKSLRLIRRIFRQRVLVVFLILAQFAFLGYTIFSNSLTSDIVGNTANLASLFVMLHVIASKHKPAYKISLIFIIFLFPLFGGIFYIVYKSDLTLYAMSKRLSKINKDATPAYRLCQSAKNEAKEELEEYSTQIAYADDYMGFPIYKNTSVDYFKSGEDMFDALCKDLENAEKYIFLEFFIVKEGKMWQRLEQILEKKAADGVDVRLIYDDMGCLYGFTDKKVAELIKKKIKISIFNPFVPFISSVQNHRDHRKIAIIDGKIAYTGGINIADEYINEKERFGHWKDTAIRLYGDAAWSFTVMFLQMWSLCEECRENYEQYFPCYMPIGGNGYVLPYTDSPIDAENLSENIYMQVIGGAKKYLYITTPYLIVDDDLLGALCFASKSGVDVRIITPYKYDKFIVHFMTRSYYKQLIDAGVKVYEYTPGFIHAKSFVSDDKRAVVGTVNLDFRSLYLHFECAALLYDCDAVLEVKNDFTETLKLCRQISEKECRCGVIVRFFRSVLRIFAPLM